MNTAIVTGANGFIGGAVCRALLKDGIAVYALVRKKESMQNVAQAQNLIVVESDIAHYDQLSQVLPQGADVFYHFAWDGTSGDSLKDPAQQIKNIQYTCDALMLAIQIRCKKFIMAGTINELELFQFMHAEKSPPRAACIYGIAKLASDFICKTLAQSNGIIFNSAIIGSCFGPGDRSMRIHNAFIQGMLQNKAPKLVAADNLHDWIYIDDVADMFVAIGHKSVHLKNYYMGHRNLRVFKDILLQVRDILNPTLDVRFGEIPGSFTIDYSQVNLNSVYEDTDYRCHSDFADCIKKTAEWVSTLPTK